MICDICDIYYWYYDVILQQMTLFSIYYYNICIYFYVYVIDIFVYDVNSCLFMFYLINYKLSNWPC